MTTGHTQNTQLRVNRPRSFQIFRTGDLKSELASTNATHTFLIWIFRLRPRCLGSSSSCYEKSAPAPMAGRSNGNGTPRMTSQPSHPTLPCVDGSGTDYGSENLDGNEVVYYLLTMKKGF